MSEKRVNIIYDLQDKVSKPLDKIRGKGQSTFNKVGKSAKTANKQVNKLSRTNFEPMIGSLTRIAGLLAAGFGIRSIIDTRVEFENFAVVLETMYGSAEKGQSVLDNLSNFAKNTPNQLNQVIDSFVKLKGIGIEATNNELMALSDLGAAAGKGILEAAMATQGALTGEFERLKALNVVARSSGDQITFTYKNQQTTVEKTNDAIKEYLFSLGRMEGVAGTSQKMMSTLGGSISNMKDSAYFAMNALGEMSSNGLIKVIKGISKLLQQTPKIIKWFERWGVVITPIVSGLAAFFIAKKVSTWFLILRKATRGLTFSFKALNKAIKANPFVFIVTTLVTVGVAVYKLQKKFGGLKNMLSVFGKFFKSLFKGIWGIIQEGSLIVTSFFNNIKLNIGRFIQSAINRIIQFKDYIGLTFKGIGLNFQIFFKQIGNRFEIFWLKIKRMGENIKNFFKKVGQSVKLLAKGQFGAALDVMSSKVENKFDSIIKEKRQEQEKEISKLQGELDDTKIKRSGVFDEKLDNKFDDMITNQKKKDQEIIKLVRGERKNDFGETKKMFNNIKDVVKGDVVYKDGEYVKTDVTTKEGDKTTNITNNIDQTTVETKGGLTQGGSSTLSSQRNVRNVTLNIDNLIETLNINTTQLKESTTEVESTITRMLQKSIVDATGFQN